MQPPSALISSTDYLTDLIEHISSAQTRVWLIALVIVDDEGTRELVNALEAAAARGVEVNIASDLFFTYRELVKMGTKLGYVRTRLRSMYSFKRRIERAGGKVTWLGQWGLLMFSRRTHTKWTIVDDTVYTYGGVNLYSSGITNNDFMMYTNDRVTADWFVEQQRTILRYDRTGRARRSHDHGDADNRVLIDGGMMGDSLIYRRACALAAQSESVRYISQYAPTGKLLRLLRRTDTTYYFNRWENADSLNRAWLRFDSFIHPAPNSYDRRDYLHAKFILFRLTDGRTAAITGSHNFVAGGGLLGTREVALETYDPEVIEMLEAFFHECVE